MDYGVGDRIEAVKHKTGEWEEGKIVEFDPNDIKLPYQVRFTRDCYLQWTKENEIRDLIEIQPIILSSQGICPLCGSTGIIGFNLFRCSNSNCRNNR